MTFHILQLQGLSILEQLQLEEQLLREDERNFCILNHGSPPSIVMGISGRPQELIDTQRAFDLGVPVIKRFSGGGTVVVDEDTLFVTFLCNKKDFSFPAYPEKILQWSEGIYQKALLIPGFSLKENDFTIGSFKCGGNAQYIKKDRWLQHTSFLWNYCPCKMSSLLFPKKTPSYRKGRSHQEFLCTLNQFLPSKESFFQLIRTHLENQYQILDLSLEDFACTPLKSRRQTEKVELY